MLPTLTTPINCLVPTPYSHLLILFSFYTQQECSIIVSSIPIWNNQHKFRIGLCISPHNAREHIVNVYEQFHQSLDFRPLFTHSPSHPVTHWSIRLPIHSFIHSLTLPSVTRCLCQSTRLNWPDAPSRANSCLKCCFHLLLLLRVGVAYVNTLNTFDFVYVECSAMFKWAQVGGAGRCRAKQRMIIAIAVEIQIEIEIGIRIQIKKKRAHAAYK